VAVGAFASSLATRRGAIVAAFLAVAVALGVAIFRPAAFTDRKGPVGEAISNQVAKGVANVQALGNSVADILAGRSPGERLAGVLANLKHRRAPALHQRALPKVRRPASPLANIVAAPAAPIIPPPAGTPLYNVVNSAPVVPAVAATPAPGAPPVIFPGFTPPPGGGGGIIIPPIVETPPVTPPPVVTPPTTPAVPEPTTWAMMLLGFAMIGFAVRKRVYSSLPIAAG